MSGLDVGSILQSLGGDRGGNVLGGLQGLLQGAGGLGGVLDQLQASGLGDQVQSWIGTGQNKKVSAQQIQQALGDDGVAAVANKAGVSKDEAASGIAEVLPQLVDKLTPDGKLPDLGPVDDLLKKLL
jgi:uncharacterized protein YidB (DUF937 family)